MVTRAGLNEMAAAYLAGADVREETGVTASSRSTWAGCLR